MTDRTHTFPHPLLRLEATADEQTIVAALPSGREKTLVTAETNPLTGGSDFFAGSSRVKKDLRRSRLSMPTLLIVGDSLTFANTVDLPTSYQYVDNGYATWAIGLSGYHPRKIINAGVGGEHAYQIAARIDSVLTSAGEVDDIILMVGSNHSDTQAAHQSYINSVAYIVSACRATGAHLWLLHNPGFNTDTATLTAIRRAEGAWLKEAFSSLEKVTVIDMYPIVMDTGTGDWKTNYSYDGLHPGSLGGYFMGKAIPLPPCPVLPSFVGEPGLLNSNPLFSGTGGTNGAGCSGAIATGWTGLCSNATAVHSQEIDDDGVGNRQVATITASAAGYYMLYAANLSLLAGLEIAGVAEISVESPVAVECVRLYVTHSGASSTSWSARSGNTTVPHAEGFSVKPITRLMTTTADTVVGQLTVRVDFKTAGSAVLKVSRAGVFDMAKI